MRTYITTLILAATLGLVSCGGGNDVASGRATAVSAAATDSKPDASTASAPSITPATPTTEPKVNGQVDERTGVAPVVAQLTIWTVYSNGGCGNSSSYYGVGPYLNNAQYRACDKAITAAQTSAQCTALGGSFSPFTQQSYPDYPYGICNFSIGPN